MTALCIVVLAVTGYFIGSPPPSMGGARPTGHFLFGYIRFVHFVAGMILGVMFLLRIYRVLLSAVRMPRQIFYVPFWSLAWWKDLFGEVRWYLFLKQAEGIRRAQPAGALRDVLHVPAAD